MKRLIFSLLAVSSAMTAFGQGIPYILNKGGRGTNAVFRGSNYVDSVVSTNVATTNLSAFQINMVGTGTATLTSTGAVSVVAPSLSSSNIWDSGNPLFWGASGNGENASGYIQAALTNGTETHITKGVAGLYVVNTTLTIPSGHTLRIDEGVTLRAATNLAGPLLQNSDTAGGNVNIRLEGGVYDGNRLGQTGHTATVYFKNVTEAKISNVLVTNSPVSYTDNWNGALRLLQCTNVTLLNCTMSDAPSGDGLSTDSSAHVSVIGGNYCYNGGSGIDSTASPYTLITGAQAFSNTASGISLNSQHSTVTGCHAYGNGDPGINIAHPQPTNSASFSAVAGNISHHNTGYGIQVQPGSTISVQVLGNQSVTNAAGNYSVPPDTADIHYLPGNVVIPPLPSTADGFQLSSTATTPFPASDREAQWGAATAQKFTGTGTTNQDIVFSPSGAGAVIINGGYGLQWIASTQGGPAFGPNVAGVQFRNPTESMTNKFLLFRAPHYIFENDTANWRFQITPSGLNVGSLADNYSIPQSMFEIDGNLCVGTMYVRTNAAPVNGLLMQGWAGFGPCYTNGTVPHDAAIEARSTADDMFKYQRMVGTTKKIWAISADDAGTYWYNKSDSIQPLTLGNAGDVTLYSTLLVPSSVTAYGGVSAAKNASPALTVNSTNDLILTADRVYQATNRWGLALYADSSAVQLTARNAEPIKITPDAVGSYGITVLSNGYVGVNQGAPSVPLQVTGTASATSVGVGTASPNTKFEVNGSAGDPSISIGVYGGVAAFSGGSVSLEFGRYNSAPYYPWMQGRKTDSGAAYPIIVQPVGGNVGIGTNNPQTALHVNGTITAQTNVVAGQYGQFIGNGAGLSNIVGSATTGTNLAVYSSGQPALTSYGGWRSTNAATGSSLTYSNGVWDYTNAATSSTSLTVNAAVNIGGGALVVSNGLTGIGGAPVSGYASSIYGDVIVRPSGNGSIYFYGTGQGRISYSAGMSLWVNEAAPMKFWVNNAMRMMIASDGAVTASGTVTATNGLLSYAGVISSNPVTGNQVILTNGSVTATGTGDSGIDRLFVTNGLFTTAPTNGVAPPSTVIQPIGCFGFMGMSGSTNTVTVGSSGTYYVVTNFNSFRTNNFVVSTGASAGGYLTNLYAGFYRISYYLSCVSGNSDTLEVEVNVNGTGKEEISGFATYDNPARMRVISGGGILYLPANSYVSLQVNNRSSASNVTIWRGGLNIGTP